MRTCLHLFILSMMSIAQAAEWGDVLRSVDGGKLRQSRICSSTQIQPEICRNPVAEVCKEKGLAGESAKALKELRKTVSQPSSGDLLDQLYQKMIDAQNRAEQVNQALVASYKALEAVQPGKPARTSTSSREGSSSTVMKMEDVKTPPEGSSSANAADVEKKQAEHESAIRVNTQARMDLYNAQKAVFGGIAKLEAEILKKFGKNESQLKSYLASVRASLIKQVSQAPEFNFTSDEKEVRPSRQMVLQALNAVGFTSAVELSAQRTPKDEDLVAEIDRNKGFFASCSDDGLAQNAYFDSRNKTLTVCPGLIFHYLFQSGTLESMSAIVGHEFGHSIDSKQVVIPHDSLVHFFESAPRASFDHSSTRSSFQSFLECIDHYFIADPGERFTRLDDVIKYLDSESIPKIKKKLELQLAINPPDLEKIAGLKQAILILEEYLAGVKARLYLSGRKNSVIQVQEGELEADYESSFVLRDQLAKAAPSKRSQLITSALQVYCSTPEEERNEAVYYGSHTDPTHPPRNFRIENYFRNPEIRALLGCTALGPEDRPWCSLAGPLWNANK